MTDERRTMCERKNKACERRERRIRKRERKRGINREVQAPDKHDKNEQKKMALTHLARLHPAGNNICWPYHRAEGRLRLASLNLPTDYTTLLDLMTQVYSNRVLELCMKEVTDDYAMTYGRRVMDPTKPWNEACRVIKR